jgi:hypothetical protein
LSTDPVGSGAFKSDKNVEPVELSKNFTAGWSILASVLRLRSVARRTHGVGWCGRVVRSGGAVGWCGDTADAIAAAGGVLEGGPVARGVSGHHLFMTMKLVHRAHWGTLLLGEKQ